MHSSGLCAVTNAANKRVPRARHSTTHSKVVARDRRPVPGPFRPWGVVRGDPPGCALGGAERGPGHRSTPGAPARGPDLARGHTTTHDPGGISPHGTLCGSLR